MKACINCGLTIPLTARFCNHCGAEQPVLVGAEGDAGAIGWDWQAPLVPQAFTAFQERLTKRQAAEQAGQDLTVYQERLYGSQFRETVQRRLEQWAEGVDVTAAETLTEARRDLRHLTDDLLDYFFVVHCQDLNPVVLPEEIVRYHYKEKAELDLAQVALIYLHFEPGEHVVYTDFLRMPERKLKHASQHFLFAERNEQLWFICDQSLLGSTKKGFAMTDRALYWKTGLQPAQRVYYHKLFSLEKEREWLLINELYFNADPQLNTRMIWLLRRLARLYQAQL
ncbi:MAG: zinc ribbon domain-containing protein [Bacteroidota bacterium]